MTGWIGWALEREVLVMKEINKDGTGEIMVNLE